MNEETSKLIALQEVDSEIAVFDQKVNDKKSLISDREHSIETKQNKIEECQQNSTELEEKHNEVKSELEDAQIRIKESQGKMMQVQTSREHQALLKEIEDNKRMIKESEEKLLQIMEDIETLQTEAGELENLCKGERELLSDETKKVNKAITTLNNRKKTIVSKRDKLSVDLRAGLLKRYNMLLSKRAGTAVVQAIHGVCQGCFMTIPPQQFNELRKGDNMYFCPTCQRILYYKAQEAEAVEG